MKWKVEYITPDSCNILIDDKNIEDVDKDVVGMAFPLLLAERIVNMHNSAIDMVANNLSFVGNKKGE